MEHSKWNHFPHFSVPLAFIPSPRPPLGHSSSLVAFLLPSADYSHVEDGFIVCNYKLDNDFSAIKEYKQKSYLGLLMKSRPNSFLAKKCLESPSWLHTKNHLEILRILIHLGKWHFTASQGGASVHLRSNTTLGSLLLRLFLPSLSPLQSQLSSCWLLNILSSLLLPDVDHSFPRFLDNLFLNTLRSLLNC